MRTFFPRYEASLIKCASVELLEFMAGNGGGQGTLLTWGPFALLAACGREDCHEIHIPFELDREYNVSHLQPDFSVNCPYCLIPMDRAREGCATGLPVKWIDGVPDLTFLKVPPMV